MGLGELSMLHSPVRVTSDWKKSEEPADMNTVIEVIIGVKRENPENLAKALKAVSDPTSDSYLQYPTAAELAEISKPSDESIEVVKKFIRLHNMNILSIHPDGDYITCSASLSQIEQAAHSSFNVYYHIRTGIRVVRVTGGVKVPKTVAAAIDTFTGFHSFPLVRSQPKVPENVQFAGTVNPSLIKSTYGITAVPKSGLQNIQAIVQFEGQFVNDDDLKKFCETYNNGTSCKINKYIGRNDQHPAGGESMLDVEYLSSIGNTTTWVYSYPRGGSCNSYIAFTANVSAATTFPYVISISYGGQEAGCCPPEVNTRLAEDFQKLGLKGISVMFASGDDGSGGESGTLEPAFPASIPDVTAVGSTYFISGISGEEEATTSFGSGGGFSFDYSLPSYQSTDVKSYLGKVKLPQKKYATNGRGTPDVSLLGESYTIILDGLTTYSNGTSASAPTFAGIISLLNEICLTESGKSLGFLNPFLYGNPNMLTDITKGTNAIEQNKAAGWDAITGWDACTGLGTPNFKEMAAVVKTLCAKAARK